MGAALSGSLGSDQLSQLLGSAGANPIQTSNMSADGIDHDNAQNGVANTHSTAAPAGQRSLGTSGQMPYQLGAGQSLVDAGTSNSTAASGQASITGLLQALFPQASTAMGQSTAMNTGTGFGGMLSGSLSSLLG